MTSKEAKDLINNMILGLGNTPKEFETQSIINIKESLNLAKRSLEFAEFTGKMLFDDWEQDCNGVFPELACRRLVELSIVELKDGEYSLKRGDEEKHDEEKPIGRWIPHEDFHPNLRYGCNICGNLTKERLPYCPCCESKMEVD